MRRNYLFLRLDFRCFLSFWKACFVPPFAEQVWIPDAEVVVAQVLACSAPVWLAPGAVTVLVYFAFELVPGQLAVVSLVVRPWPGVVPALVWLHLEIAVVLLISTDAEPALDALDGQHRLIAVPFAAADLSKPVPDDLFLSNGLLAQFV